MQRQMVRYSYMMKIYEFKKKKLDYIIELQSPEDRYAQFVDTSFWS